MLNVRLIVSSSNEHYQLSQNASRTNLLKIAAQNQNKASIIATIPPQEAQWRGSKMPNSSGSPPREAASGSSRGEDDIINIECNSHPMYEQPAAPKIWHLGMFEIGRPLGKGKFGRVYLVRERRSGFICALKVLDRHKIQQGKTEKLVRREIEIQRNLRHPNILQLYDHFHDDKRVVLILEFAFNGDLSKHLRRENSFSERKAAQYIAQTAAALKYLHRSMLYTEILSQRIFLSA